ncbi:gluconolaconase [Pontibacter diazotrophicus]|uniref:Gluconolaconase n=1 Tax=Pontibacter diazotrophicus TaxID=1400979 RepID=A0A3D8LG39_9BACT|nr:PQQ-binding-like beta-propeller repeat protein [Pontibacter diazotrophicus]RDV16375.1 gluconolaconase [Pontibacter diazotrophicus]
MRILLQNAFFVFLLVGLNSCIGRLFSSRAPVELEQAWASDNTLRTPESVVHDPLRNTIYVSNINEQSGTRKDGDGFISRLSTTGQIEELYWVSGLNDPKGTALHNNVLYVADVDEIVAISTQTGSVLGKYKADNARDLNGITVDNNGNVFVTDSDQRRIYQLNNGRVSVWVDNTRRENPNGIYKEGNRMIVAFMNSGKIRFLDPETKNFTDWTDGIKSADGIAEAGDGNYLISSWDGEIFYVNSNGKNWSVLNTRGQNMNTADISYAERLGVLLVPTFKDNRVVAYRVRQR